MTPNELKNKTNKELSDLVDDNEAALAADPDDFRAECNLTMVRSEIGKRAMPIVLAVYLID